MAVWTGYMMPKDIEALEFDPFIGNVFKTLDPSIVIRCMKNLKAKYFTIGESSVSSLKKSEFPDIIQNNFPALLCIRARDNRLSSEYNIAEGLRWNGSNSGAIVSTDLEIPEAIISKMPSTPLRKYFDHPWLGDDEIIEKTRVQMSNVNGQKSSLMYIHATYAPIRLAI